MLSSKSLSHGGNLLFASKEFEREDFLDYSSNINPLGVPLEYKELIINNIDKLASYPNIDYLELKKSIGRYLNINQEYILPTSGATEAIYLILQHLSLKKVILPVPSFSEYENACKNFNIEIVFQFTKEEENFQVNILDLERKIRNKEGEAVFLCNPNNPTSQLIERKEILHLLEIAKENGVYVLIDESFIDLIEKEEQYTLREYISKFHNLIIIQSFTKFFGIPGIRIGCVIGNTKLINELFDKKMPWSINYFASLMSHILKRNSSYVIKTKAWIKSEVQWFYNELIKFEGIEVIKPNTNFVLMKLVDSKYDAKRFRIALGKEGVLIRDCSNFKGLDNRYIRLAIKNRENNIRVLKELKKFFNLK